MPPSLTATSRASSGVRTGIFGLPHQPHRVLDPLQWHHVDERRGLDLLFETCTGPCSPAGRPPCGCRSPRSGANRAREKPLRECRASREPPPQRRLPGREHTPRRPGSAGTGGVSPPLQTSRRTTQAEAHPSNRVPNLIGPGTQLLLEREDTRAAADPACRWTGRPARRCQRCTVLTSRCKWLAISFHELSRRPPVPRLGALTAPYSFLGTHWQTLRAMCTTNVSEIGRIDGPLAA